MQCRKLQPVDAHREDGATTCGAVVNGCSKKPSRSVYRDSCWVRTITHAELMQDGVRATVHVHTKDGSCVVLPPIGGNAVDETSPIQHNGGVDLVSDVFDNLSRRKLEWNRREPGTVGPQR